MSLFNPKPARQSFIGVDLGASGIKLVELLNEKNRARLQTYAYVEIPSKDRAYFEDAKRTGELLKKVIAQAKCTTKKAISALPAPAVFSSIISVDALKDKEFEAAVYAQAKKLVPMPIEEVVIDYKKIEMEEDGDGKKINRVLITAAPKTLVARYTEIFKVAELELTSLETEIFALVRALIGKDRSTIMIVDIGSQRTNIMVIERGIPFLTRSIATGGVAITENIAKTLGLSFAEADSMKKDIRSLQSFAPAGEIKPILEALLKPIADEVRYTFNLYQEQAQDGKPKKVDKIILTGGSVLLPRLPEFMTELLNVNAYLGDPWARVIYPPGLRPILDDIGSRFSVAMGCAMRDIE
jgi:type IV pilus assembly protein PilM